MSGTTTHQHDAAALEPDQVAEFPQFPDFEEPDVDLLLATEAEAEASHQNHVRGLRKALIVLVSDRNGELDEEIPRLVTELLVESGFVVDGAIIVKSRKSKIRQAIETAVVGGVDLVVTVGGVGVGPRDKTPEATNAVLDQHVPGIAQALRASGLGCRAVDACISRGVSGVSGSTAVVNLADSRAAIRDGMATLTPLVHAVIDQLYTASGE